MPEKRVLPLNNPVSQKAVVDEANKQTSTSSGGEGVRQGGEGKVKMTTEKMLEEYQEMCQRNEGARPTIYMLLRCRQCYKEQQITFFYWTPPKMHACIGCGEKQPTQGYAMIAHANSPFG